MTEVDIPQVLSQQRLFFETQRTKTVAFRQNTLIALRNAILKYEDRLNKAAFTDLHKSPFEFYATEIGQVLNEIRFHLKKVKRWAKPRRISTPITHFKAKSRIHPEPYGNVLIMAPWNYPFNLLINPLVGAISAGNTAILKPSNYTPHVSRVIKTMIEDTFNPEYIAVFEGGREMNQALLEHKFDLSFFTGSPTLGRIVMQAASHHLTPVVLELGGKSPCIVHADANIKLAARRITWGKFINAGQTCIAL